MLVLSESDILKAVSCQEVVMAVEKALLMYEKQEFYMPQRMHLDYNGDVLLLMPCFTPESAATKLVSVYPGNREKGKPVISGVVVLNDVETGEPLAVINGAKLTAVRTGAVGGVAVRYMSAQETSSVGIIGAGIQGFHQAIFTSAVRKIQKVIVYDLDSSAMESFCKEFKFYYPRITIEKAKRIEELLTQTNLVITATPSVTPVIPDDATLIKGKKIIGFGSYKPEMREFPEALFRTITRLFIDTDHAIEETGDLIDPLKKGWISRDQVLTAGKLISGEEKVDLNETYLFKSVGMALFDLVVSEYIYRKAKEQGIGTEVEM